MEFAYHIDGGTAPYIKKYQIGETVTLAGVPFLVPTLANTSGVLLASTTGAANMVGLSIDVPAARVTAQQTANADTERLVSLIVNPNAVFKGRLSGAAAAGTLLPLFANTLASTTGALITATISTAYDDGYTFGFDGANVGQLRKLSAAGGTDAAYVIAFNNDIAVGDNFLMVTFGPGEAAGVQLCTELTEIDASGDNQGGTNFRCVELLMRDRADEGRGTSFAYIVPVDHLFASN